MRHPAVYPLLGAMPGLVAVPCRPSIRRSVQSAHLPLRAPVNVARGLPVHGSSGRVST